MIMLEFRPMKKSFKLKQKISTLLMWGAGTGVLCFMAAKSGAASINAIEGSSISTAAL